MFMQITIKENMQTIYFFATMEVKKKQLEGCWFNYGAVAGVEVGGGR